MQQLLLDIVVALIMFLLLWLTFGIRGFLLKRAALQVVRILQRHNCRCPWNSKTLDELGLRPPDFFARIGKPKDYKPYALQALARAGVIRITDDERLCLVEEKLAERLREDRGTGREARESSEE